MKEPVAERPVVVLTIGHSTHPLAEFLSLLRAHGVARLVDVRRMPWSRRNPQFNKESLPDALRTAGLAYQHIGELGGPAASTPAPARRLTQHGMAQCLVPGLCRLHADT